MQMHVRKPSAREANLVGAAAAREVVLKSQAVEAVRRLGDLVPRPYVQLADEQPDLCAPPRQALLVRVVLRGRSENAVELQPGSRRGVVFRQTLFLLQAETLNPNLPVEAANSAGVCPDKRRGAQRLGG